MKIGGKCVENAANVRRKSGERLEDPARAQVPHAVLDLVQGQDEHEGRGRHREGRRQQHDQTARQHGDEALLGL